LSVLAAAAFAAACVPVSLDFFASRLASTTCRWAAASGGWPLSPETVPSLPGQAAASGQPLRNRPSVQRRACKLTQRGEHAAPAAGQAWGSRTRQSRS
jgi:hypothetical protein